MTEDRERTEAARGRGSARLLAALAATALTLGGAELGLRIFGGGDEAYVFRSNFRAMSADGLLVPHRSRFYTLRPERRATDEHAGRYASGSWPFRGRPPCPTPLSTWPTTQQHVLVFGDSCVFGQGLDPTHTLPAALSLALERTGFPPASVHVSNLGVPGYSLVQIKRLMDEVLPLATPAAVVLYPGAWNDQAVATSRGDMELARDGSSLLGQSELVQRLRRALVDDESRERLARERVDAFEAGSEDVPRRVPLTDYLALLDEIFESLQDYEAELIVVAPAHPTDTATRFPATRAYAEETLAWARRKGAVAIDGQAVLAASGLRPETLFLDFVHPSPPATSALAASIADLLRGALEPRTPSPGVRWSVRPSSVSSLGDTWIELEPQGSASLGDELLAAVGEAPLLDVTRTPTGGLRGRTLIDAPGTRSILVWTARGWQETGARLEAKAPTLTFSTTPTLHLSAASRPGDRWLIRASHTLRESPEWTSQGESWLGEAELLPDSFELVCDAAGRADLDLEPFRDSLTNPLYAQAWILPRGVPEDGTFARFSTVATIELR